MSKVRQIRENLYKRIMGYVAHYVPDGDDVQYNKDTREFYSLPDLPEPCGITREQIDELKRCFRHLFGFLGRRSNHTIDYGNKILDSLKPLEPKGQGINDGKGTGNLGHSAPTNNTKGE